MAFVFPLVIYNIAADFDLDFFALYSCTGLWNSFFLFVYSTFGLSQIMKWSTRYSVSSMCISFIFLRFKKKADICCVIFHIFYLNNLYNKKKVTVSMQPCYSLWVSGDSLSWIFSLVNIWFVLTMFSLWQDSPEVNPSTLIGYYLVHILA